RLRQSQRESRIVRAWCGIAARVVVHDEQRGGARCQARGNKHVRNRDGRARARAARKHVPGEEAMASGEARNGENLHRLIAQQWRERGRGNPRVAEGLYWHMNRLALVIAQRAVRAEDLADTMSAGKTAVQSR